MNAIARCLTFILLSHATVWGAIRVEVLRGHEIDPYLDAIVELCSRIYSQPPYCYDGQDSGYDIYLQSYARSESAIICLAFDGTEPIGIAAGIPMSKTRDLYQEPLLSNNDDLEKLFYVGEFGLQPEYQGLGIERSMYLRIERFAKWQGNYSAICFWEVIGSSNSDYFPNPSFWEKYGFSELPHLHFSLYWTNVGETQETPHAAVYWMKRIGA